MTIGAPRLCPSMNVHSHSNASVHPVGAGGPTQYLYTLLHKRSPLLQHFYAGLLTLMLAFAPAAPAQSSVFECIEAAIPIEGSLEAIELAGKLTACTAEAASGDAVMALTILTMTGLAVHGDIPADTDRCYAAIDQVIGKILALALIDSGVAAKVFGDWANVELQKVADNVITFHQLVDQIPALAILLTYVNCGCIIVGAPDAAKEIADKYLAHVEGCAAAFEDAGNAFLGFIEALICDGLLFGHCSSAGGEGDPNCYVSGAEAMYVQHGAAPASGHCELGMQCNKCGFTFCGAVDRPAFGISPGLCACNPPFTSNYSLNFPNGKLESCTCNPPKIQHRATVSVTAPGSCRACQPIPA
jgi:hypothetical protein